MTGTPAAVERQSVLTRQRLNKPSESHEREAIQQRARELADLAPPLTSEQIVLLKAVFSHREGGGG
jgi:hypothetical protein